MSDQYNNPLAALQDIKKYMQQSSRVLSLSGWSGIWAGGVAILGTLYFNFIYSNYGDLTEYNTHSYTYIDHASISPSDIEEYQRFFLDSAQQDQLLFTALLVFVVAVIGAIFFTYNKNRKKGIQQGFNEIVKKLIINLAIPILAGGAFCLHFFCTEQFYYLAPCSLVFYGLALINCSKYTFTQIKYLGLLEVILGIMALFLMKYHIILWALGFGVLHIVYGIFMWYKYDRK